jgi:hypothetical protein
MPKPHLNLFKFDESYASEWNAFIDLFPKDEELDQESLTLEIKQYCQQLNVLFQELYTTKSDYAMQCEIRWVFNPLMSVLQEEDSVYTEHVKVWFLQQVMNMINCDNPKIVESIWYAISVDYFECSTAGSWMFPIMYKELAEKDMKKLLMYSISIPWKDKVETYREMIDTAAHHEMLADALYHSCNAYCHTSAKSSEALEILNQLTISKAEYDKVFNMLTQPIEVHIVAAIPLSKSNKDQITSFVSIQSQHIPTWFPYAELWVDNNCLGQFSEENLNLTWKGYNSIQSRYKIATPEEQGHQEHILQVKIAFEKNWQGKRAVLKPV